MSLTPPLEAASISTRSRARFSAAATHNAQVLHGSPSSAFGQLTARNRIRAALVLPVPRGPVNRYACDGRPSLTAFFRVRVTCSWPKISSKRRGRQRRYRTRRSVIAGGGEGTDSGLGGS